MIPIKSGTFTVLQSHLGIGAGPNTQPGDSQRIPGGTPVVGVFARHTDNSVWQMTFDASVGVYPRGASIVLASTDVTTLYNQRLSDWEST